MIPINQNKIKIKIIVYALTIILILFFSIYQIRSFKSNMALTDQQLRLHTLKERILYLDEALTMSARLYVLENDTKWKDRYDKFVPEYYLYFNELNKILPKTYNGKDELAFASEQLFALETKAFEYVKQNRYKEAKNILFGPPYIQQSKGYQSALVKVTTEIDRLSDELHFTYRRTNIIQFLLALLILLSIVTGWSIYNYLSTKWHLKNNKIAIEKAEAAIAAEERLQGLNAQLRLLSGHLQEIREKDKQHIAYEISEELGQQLITFKVKFTEMLHLLNKEALPPHLIQEAKDQLSSVMLYLNDLALDVYPSILKDLGLIDALSWEIERLADQKKISILFFTNEEELHLEDAVAIKIFRVVEDKLRSLIFKKASDIIVALSIENQNLILSFDHDAKETMSSEGSIVEQLIMDEYLRGIEGKFTTNMSTDGYHNFTISIPLTQWETAL